MGQDILMWICVFAAFGYTFFSLVKMIWHTFQESKMGCTGGCSSCSAKTDLLKQINFKPNTKNKNGFKMIIKDV